MLKSSELQMVGLYVNGLNVIHLHVIHAKASLKYKTEKYRLPSTLSNESVYYLGLQKL